MARPFRNLWTPTEDSLLRQMSAAGVTVERMSKELHRGETAICERRVELGLARRLGTPLAVLLVRAAAAFGDGPFTEQDLAVAAWRRSPIRFGMAHGQMPHPDLKVVSACVCSKRTGPVAKGWLERCGVGLFRLTEAGRKLVAQKETA